MTKPSVRRLRKNYNSQVSLCSGSPRLLQLPLPIHSQPSVVNCSYVFAWGTVHWVTSNLSEATTPSKEKTPHSGEPSVANRSAAVVGGCHTSPSLFRAGTFNLFDFCLGDHSCGEFERHNRVTAPMSHPSLLGFLIFFCDIA